MPIGNGGIIGPANVPTITTASGVWSLREQQQAQGRGAWPLALLPDPYFEYTTLLLPGNGTNGAQNNTFLDGSTNNFTITRNGNTTQGTFSPFSQTGWGNYFDGSSQYLSLANNAVFDFDANPFTIETWFYITGNAAQNNDLVRVASLFCAFPTSGSTANVYNLYLDGNGTTTGTGIGFSKTVSGSNINVSYAATIAQNTWHHVAVVRSSSTTLTLYLDGQQVAQSTSYSGNVNTGGNPISVAQLGYVGYLNRFPGYVSNLRITKGRAVYTGAFTPPTSPLTRTTGGTNPPQGTECSLLTCQSNRFLDSNGVNTPASSPLTITPNGSPTVVAFSPFNPTLPWIASISGGSGYFDGSGDYLSVADNTALDFEASDFTVECWFYPTQTISGVKAIFGKRVAATFGGVQVYFNSSFAPILEGSVTGSTWSPSITSSKLCVLNQWNHIAATRNSNTWTIWVNGESGGSQTVSGTIANNTAPFTIGADAGGASNIISSGYIANFRFVKGTAVYTGAFTPPIAPLTNAGATSASAYSSTTNVNTTFSSTNCSLLLNFTNAGIYDATGKNNIETVNDARISTAITPKWGNGSILLEPSVGSTQDYLLSSAPLSELAFLHNGTPWTVEGWFYTGSTSGRQTILSTNAASASIGMAIDINNTTAGDFVCSIYRGVSGSYLTATSSGSVWNVNTWNYFAVVLDASKNLTLYINGSQVATTSGSSFSFSSSNPTYPLVIGRYQFSTPGGYFNGYLQDIRITRGIARTITTPTAAFPTL